MFTPAQPFLTHAEAAEEVVAIAAPVVVPFKFRAGFAEEFKLHLLKFPCAENEVARSDFVAEGFADLCNSERDFFAHRALNILKVDKNALRGFGAKINLVCRVFVDTLEGFEHHVEFADAGEIMLSAFGADNALFVDVCFHLFVRPAVGVNIGKSVCFGIIFDKLIGAEPCFAGSAIHERIIKIDNVPACNPYFGVHQNRAVNADIIGAFLNEFAPPCAFDVVKEKNAERTVVPAIRQPAVNFRS